MLKYYKNFILCGEIDYFCILCHESFESTADVEKHIRWEKHRKLFKVALVNVIPQSLCKDRIYKVENYYYCNLCNVLAANLSTINEHVKETCSLNNNNDKVVIKEESSKVAKRELGFVIVSNCAVTKREWHGVINGQCLFCNTPAGDFEKHVRLTSHMVKFIQAELKVEDNGWVYRKINLNSYYCFKCKKTVEQESLSDHPNCDDHSTNIVMSKGAEVKQLFEVDKENALATCTVCNKVVFWSSLPMSDHRKEHIDKKEWENNEMEEELEFMALCFQDKGKLRSDLKKFGADNFIKMTEGGGKGYCSLCNTFISAHIRNFRQHVNGIRHMNHLELKGLIKKSKKSDKPRHKTKTIRQLFDENELVFIKEKSMFLFRDLCIGIFNFILMSSPDVHGGKIICYLCDTVYDNLESHLASGHREKFFAVPVITTLKDEFVREIRPGLYHCGICNIPFAGWSVLEKHFNQFKHRFAKIDSKKQFKEVEVSLTLNENDSDCDCSCTKCTVARFPDFLD